MLFSEIAVGYSAFVSSIHSYFALGSKLTHLLDPLRFGFSFGQEFAGYSEGNGITSQDQNAGPRLVHRSEDMGKPCHRKHPDSGDGMRHWRAYRRFSHLHDGCPFWNHLCKKSCIVPFPSGWTPDPNGGAGNLIHHCRCVGS